MNLAELGEVAKAQVSDEVIRQRGERLQQAIDHDEKTKHLRDAYDQEQKKHDAAQKANKAKTIEDVKNVKLTPPSELPLKDKIPGPRHFALPLAAGVAAPVAGLGAYAWHRRRQQQQQQAAS